ncbi:MAG: TIR domain-containing protein [Brevundimonas sp.]
MTYKDPSYVIFDGDNDKWAYAFMKGWKANDRVDFDFRDAHDLDTMTGRAQSEEYVKARLRERMNNSKAAIVILGDSTKNLYKYVRWEIDLAKQIGLPIIVVNLNGLRVQDNEKCPAILRDDCAVHVSFNMAIIRHALDNWPAEFRAFPLETKAKGGRHYGTQVYQGLGL